VTEIVRANQGFVNKFMGDGILAFFATGENPVANGMRASLAILRETEAMAATEAVRQLVGDWDLRVGIGIHYGKVVMGNVGSEKKMDFTIIGEGVNIASRIEGLTKQAGKRILLSEEAYEMAKGQFAFERLGEFSVKGVDRPLALYTIAGIQTLEVSRERID
jgi:adenylate cyclase